LSFCLSLYLCFVSMIVFYEAFVFYI